MSTFRSGCRATNGLLIGGNAFRRSRRSATTVAGRAVTKADRAELERLVFVLERQHPDWSASDIERGLAEWAPASHGSWKADTPNLRARLRQVQRWRSGSRGGGRSPRTRLAYTFLWPMGEKQREAVESSYIARASSRRASHRLFLYNCSAEVVRELRAKVGGVEVAYEPALLAGAFTEIHWTRNPAIRDGLLQAAGHEALSHPLEVEFAVSNGTKRALLKGTLSLDATDGWNSFRARDGSAKEIE